MARYGIVYTLTAGARDKRHIVEGWITGVPEGLKAQEVSDALERSPHLGTYSERGVFLGNRRLLTEKQLPAGHTVASDVREHSWEELTGEQKTGRVQLNVRVTPMERARYMNAAAAAGLSLTDWVKEALERAAGKEV
ncbi:hypothetical protein [Nonomuraea sp. NPDC050310]|uniref:hypothetical protein n=1 Tax=Nonomuraea sp. NPDC050310 TaxID=3154935 RepID=UPI0033FC10C6